VALVQGLGQAGQRPQLAGVPQAPRLGAGEGADGATVGFSMLAGAPGTRAIRQPGQAVGVEALDPGPHPYGGESQRRRNRWRLQALGACPDQLGPLDQAVGCRPRMGQAPEFSGLLLGQGSYLQCQTPSSNVSLEEVSHDFGKGPLSSHSEIWFIYISGEMPQDHFRTRPLTDITFHQSHGSSLSIFLLYKAWIALSAGSCSPPSRRVTGGRMVNLALSDRERR
jgi:hypothetical protein